MIQTTQCNFCKKKTLILITCRCTKKFCIKHQCAENHNCTFNFKKSGREKLLKDNPKVEFNKVLLI